MNKKLWLISFVMVLFLLASGLSYAATITIAPTDTQSMTNTFPFGGGSVGWTPYHGFIYKNVPAFNLQPGDILAFDLGLQNEVDIQLDIAMAPTTVNGGTLEAGPFTTVVTNTQTPQNPRGDTTLGNFELRFTVEQPFSFPGGGLIIRFSNPSASYAADNNSTFNLVAATTSDASGYFAGRFYRDSDGVSPWDNNDTGSIGGFQIITQDATAVAVPAMTQWGMIIIIILAGLGAINYMKRQRRLKN
jgi:hypothetical protein